MNKIFAVIIIAITFSFAAINAVLTKHILVNGYPGELVSSVGRAIYYNGIFGGNFIYGSIVAVVLVMMLFCAVYTSSAVAQNKLRAIRPVSGEDQESQRLVRYFRVLPILLIVTAVYSIFLMIVDIVGGVIVGVYQRGMIVEDALKRYSALATGDVLLNLIPLVILSLFALALVARVHKKNQTTQKL